MQALHLQEGQLRYRSEQPRPKPAADEALIRLRLMGICSTDLEIIKGYVPGFSGILGHEFVGEVVEAEERGWVGQRVVGTINVACRQCAVCVGSGPEHCPRRTVLGIINRDGVFAEYVTLPVANLLAVPEEVADEAAVFTEPLAAALRIREQLIVSPTDRVAVVGPGRLGLLVGQVLALAGSEVVMLGHRQESLALAQKLGLKGALSSAYEANSFDLVVEATGNEAGLQEALRLIRPLGRLVMKSTYAGKAKVDLTKIVVDEISIIGSRCGPFGPALRLLAQGAVEVLPLIAGSYSLAQFDEAFKHAMQPGVRKILLQPA